MNPAAVLSIMVKANGVGETTRDLGHLDKVGSRTGASLAKVGKVAAVGFAAGIGVAAVAVKGFIDAASESQASTERMKAQLKASGADYRAHAKQIDAVIQKHSKLAGVDDEDLQDAFTGIVRATGSVGKAMKDMGLVTDIMRGKNVDAASAGKLLEKVHNGNVGALKRMGISIDPVTKAQDKLKESNVKATVEQIRAAKAADKSATAQKGIAELQQRFAGQAEAYGNTAAGAQERFGVAVENLQEKLGAKLLPIFANITNAVATFIGQMESGKGAGGRFAEIFRQIAGFVGPLIGKIVEFGTTLRDAFSGGDEEASGSLSNIVNNVRDSVGKIVGYAVEMWNKIQPTFADLGEDLSDIGRAWLDMQDRVSAAVGYVIREVLPKLGPALSALWDVIRGWVKVVAGVLSGDWKKAWEGLKTVVRGQLAGTKAVIRAAWDLLGPAMISLAKFLNRKMIEGLAALPGLLKDALVEGIKLAARNVPKLIAAELKLLGKGITEGIKAGFGALNPFGDGFGKPFGDGAGIPAFGGGLKGARPSMGPVAGMASRFGLGVSSGLRRGAITSSGNKSYHSTGEALDLAGSPAGMLGFFNFMKNTAGGRLAELIYTPGGAGIKNGASYRYGGKVAADHFDHVHVAIDTGIPGVGDGIGQIQNLWTKAGGNANMANMAAAIAMAESGGNPGISHRNSDGSIDRGLWQINSVHGALSTFDRMGNARAAIKISSNGRNWNPWTVFKSGAYKRFLGKGGKSGSKGRTAPGGARSAYDPEAMYNDPRPAVTDPAMAALLRANGISFNDQSGSGLGGPSQTGPAKGAGMGPPKGLPVGYEPPEVPSLADFADSAVARARLTPGLEDDRAALVSLQAIRKAELDAALANADPRDDAAAIDAYLSVTDAIEALDGTITEQNRIAQERMALDRQLADNQLKIIALANQGPEIVAAVVAAVSGGIGGQLGLGFQTPGYAGQVARY